MRTLLAILFSLLVLSFEQTFAEAVQAPPVRTLTFAVIDFPPYYMWNGKQATGLLTEKLTKLIEHAGFKAEPRFLPTKRVAQEIALGKVDLWLGSSNTRVFKEGAFIGSSIVLKLKLSTWSLGRNIKISSLEDFKMHSVALITDFSYGNISEQIRTPQNQIKYYEVKDTYQGYLLLLNGRADTFLQYDNLMEPWLKANPRILLRKNMYAEIPWFLTVSKKTPDAAEILKRLEKALKTLDQESTEKTAP